MNPASGRSDERSRVLKHDDTFAIFDELGDINPARGGTYGIYRGGTRYLSGLRLRIQGRAPVLLGSAISRDNTMLGIDLTTPPIEFEGHGELPSAVIHVFRSMFLWDGRCYEHLRIRNHHRAALDLQVRFDFETDFIDIFELRGQARAQRGQILDAMVEDQRATLGYLGLDNLLRQAVVEAQTKPSAMGGTWLEFEQKLEPKQECEIDLVVACVSDELPIRPPAASRSVAHANLVRESADRGARCARLRSANELFNEWLDRSAADLGLLLTGTSKGLYPYAGIPWFNTPFGRDGIITGLETLWAFPDLSRGVLDFLAATQAEAVDVGRDAEPGKILHETRYGEMAATGEVPFGRYYGSVDATPLFVILADAYHQRTADDAFIRTLWPAVRAALDWIVRHGDLGGDGFVQYARMSSDGLEHQGWKDSGDAVFHADGSAARGPIALCEVQAYAYGALQAGARLGLLVGETDLAAALTGHATTLRGRFEEQFFCDEMGLYALALDTAGDPCAVRTSNAGHCLYTGICAPERANRVVAALMSDDMFSGWGVRTVGARESRYNPMGYHTGSVWPHDNAIIAAGMARYGHKAEAVRILSAMFDASNTMGLHRMPELFCGFVRREGQGPTLYPVACAPQAWAAGAVFMLLSACLGLHVDACAREVRLDHPVLPDWLERFEIHDLQVAGGSLDLAFERTSTDVAVQVMRRRGEHFVSVITRS